MKGPGDLYTGPDVECDCGVDDCDCYERERDDYLERQAENAAWDRVMFP